MSDMKCKICGKSLKAEPNLTGPGWEIFHECVVGGDTKEEAIKKYHEQTDLYTLADLEQARRQGAEEERGRCVDAVVDSTHGGALRSAVDAIRALGPIGETPEETERRVRRETVEKMSVFIARADLLQFEDEIDAIAEGK